MFLYLPSRRALSAVLVLAAVALAAACGGREERDFTSLGVPAGATVIDQYDIQFHPEDVTVDALETVWFVNSEGTRHTVTIDGSNESGEMRRDEVFSFTFGSPGEYEITCDYHPQMRATVNVE